MPAKSDKVEKAEKVEPLKYRIQNLRLSVAAPMGKGSVVMQYFYDGVRIDDAPVTCRFDEDPRFIRVDLAGKDYWELVPLTNVTSLRVVFE